MDNSQKSKISNTEWGIALGISITTDLVQALLDIFVIGVLINRFLDILFGMALGFWLQIRGESLANPKRIFGIVGAFIGEMIPGLDALPLWSLDVCYNWWLATKGKKVVASAGLDKKLPTPGVKK